jgi:DNA mismatch repair protein MutS
VLRQQIIFLGIFPFLFGCDLTFPRTVRDGATDRSYGVHVADLAGVPGPVVARSRKVLDRLREEALKRGVEDLWTELVLSQYLHDEIDRERTVELVGRDAVKRADREPEAVEEDVCWDRNA